MRADDVILAIRARQFTTMENTFKTPPQDYDGFIKQLGIWVGLNEALSVIEDARKKDYDD